MKEYEIRSAKEALWKSKQLRRIWSEESRLTQRTLVYIAQLLEQVVRQTRSRGRKVKEGK